MKSDPLAELGLAPYPEIFPRSKKGALTVVLDQKCGKARAGSYLFVEHYCVIRECDCRQVTLLVVNDKGRQAAAINFPLDIDNPFATPHLHPELKQSAAADDLLLVFIEVFNSNPDWYKEMRKRYRGAREKIDKVPYLGSRFPKFYPIGLLDEDPEVDFEKLLGELAQIDPRKKSPSQKRRSDFAQQELFADEFAAEDWSVMLELHDKYRHYRSENPSERRERQQQLRSIWYGYLPAADELAGLLHDCYFGEDDEGLQAALHMLADILEMLRVDQERNRPGAAELMLQCQTALADQLFAPGVDLGLGSQVTGVLLDSQVEILPVLHQANSRRMQAEAEEGAFPAMNPEHSLGEVLENLDQMGIESAFELTDALLQMLAVGDADAQIALSEVLFRSEHELAHEAAVLLLFHPHADVREGVADFLARAEGERFSPVSLRRLIVVRNWLPAPLRKQLDQAISNARRARVECSPLRAKGKLSIYASAVDGAGAQSFQLVLPRGRGQGYLSCSILLKKGSGASDTFVLPLPDKRELNRFLKMMRQETGATEVGREYLDQRLCQALADGVAAGKVPGHWLVAVAELLGCGQWQAQPFSAEEALAVLKEGLRQQGGEKQLAEGVRKRALEKSAHWPAQKSFAHSWFEDDAEIDRRLEPLLFSDSLIDPMEPVVDLLDHVLEARREVWLERLLLTAAWLKAAKKPSLPWGQMYHVAAAVADKSLPLKEIPLMVAIAENSIGAFMARKMEEEDLGLY